MSWFPFARITTIQFTFSFFRVYLGRETHLPHDNLFIPEARAWIKLEKDNGDWVSSANASSDF
jgi:hypothetical protein